MRSLRRRFEVIKNKNPSTGDYCCFSRAVKEQKFKRKTILDWFNKLIPKNDYSRSDRKSLIDQLEKLSNSSEEILK